MDDVRVEDVEHVRFSNLSLREGYRASDVDDFLAAVLAAMRVGEPLPALVDGARFRLAHGCAAYDRDQVDAFLARLCGQARSVGLTHTV